MKIEAFFSKAGVSVPSHLREAEDGGLKAVKQSGCAIRFIKNPSKVVQMEAVKQNGVAIQFIENPSEAVQLAAVKQNPDCGKYFKKEWFD